MVWGCEDGGGVDREEPEEGDGCHLVGGQGHAVSVAKARVVLVTFQEKSGARGIWSCGDSEAETDMWEDPMQSTSSFL
jgi:hypothetical protein